MTKYLNFRGHRSKAEDRAGSGRTLQINTVIKSQFCPGAKLSCYFAPQIAFNSMR